MSDRLAEAMLPIAAALTVAVDEEDRGEVAHLLQPLNTEQLYALAVVLAAHIDPDRPLVRYVAAATKKAARVSARIFDLDVEDVLSTSRRKEVLDARAVTYYAAYLLGDNYSQIGRVMDRDHSTVMSGYSRVATSPRLRHIAERVAGRLGWRREDEEASA